MANHPKHPATVHFPISFTFLTGALDAVYFASITPSTAPVVASGLQTLDLQLQPSTFPVLSYYTTLLTLITSVPAVISGAIELQPIIKRDGFSSRKAQVGVLHALVNDIATFAAAYNWWSRRNEVGFAPSSTNVLISAALAVPATFFAAYLGGQLVFQYGMGIGRGRSQIQKTQ